jgi:purine-binding chemotaxis protein CheW
VPSNRVQEIVRVPHAQADVEGVINLRGHVLPVVDLASRLAPGATEHARSPRVVIVDGGMQSIGLLVDGVSEVLWANAVDVDPPSATITGNGPTAVLGVTKLGERRLLLYLEAGLAGQMERTALDSSVVGVAVAGPRERPIQEDEMRVEPVHRLRDSGGGAPARPRRRAGS